MKQSSTILGVRVDTFSQAQVLQHIHRYIDSRLPHHIVTVNTEFIMAARKNADFIRALSEADIALADGAGVVLAAKLLGQPIPPRIPGVDFVQALAHEAAKNGWSLFLLGGRDGVAQKTADILTSLNPGLKISAVSESDPTDSSLVSTIHDSRSTILLVAWGAPKQDVWIHQNKQKLNVPIMMGVGGTFDFLAGKQKRAPKWMRLVGLEWLWRLALEPSRWRRQLALPQTFTLILLSKLRLIKNIN